MVFNDVVSAPLEELGDLGPLVPELLLRLEDDGLLLGGERPLGDLWIEVVVPPALWLSLAPYLSLHCFPDLPCIWYSSCSLLDINVHLRIPYLSTNLMMASSSSSPHRRRVKEPYFCFFLLRFLGRGAGFSALCSPALASGGFVELFSVETSLSPPDAFVAKHLPFVLEDLGGLPDLILCGAFLARGRTLVSSTGSWTFSGGTVADCAADSPPGSAQRWGSPGGSSRESTEWRACVSLCICARVKFLINDYNRVKRRI